MAVETTLDTNRFGLARSLQVRLVAWLFLIIGLVGILMTLLYGTRGSVTLDPLVIGLPIGIGLLRLRSGWRTSAICIASLAISGVSLLAVMIFFGVAEFVNSVFPKNLLPYAYAIACLLVAVAFAMVWSIRILLLPNIRSLFVRPTTDRVASAIPPLLVVVMLLCVSRLSGGIGGSLSVKSASLSRSTASEPFTREACSPLVVEVLADGEASHFLLNWVTTRGVHPLGMTATTTNQRFVRIDGFATPDQLRKAPHRIIVEVEKSELSGPYWLPFWKRGKAHYEAKLRGVGLYAGYSKYLQVDLDFRIVGLSTMGNLRKYLRSQVEKEARNLIIKSSSKGRGLTFLERSCRESPLASGAAMSLADSYRDLGNRYHEAGQYADAEIAYREQIFALEYRLAGDTPIHSRQLARTKTKLAQAYNHVAWKCCTDYRVEARHGSRAVEYATRACELSEWGNGMYLDTLASAYADMGDFRQATEWQKKAIELLPDSVSAAAKVRLSLYESGKAFRELPK